MDSTDSFDKQYEAVMAEAQGLPDEERQAAVARIEEKYAALQAINFQDTTDRRLLPKQVVERLHFVMRQAVNHILSQRAVTMNRGSASLQAAAQKVNTKTRKDIQKPTNKRRIPPHISKTETGEDEGWPIKYL